MTEYFDVISEKGEYTNKMASREDCHKFGLWHRAVAVFILSKDNSKILLQKRSANKKLRPNLWDISAGGHVLAGEFGYDAVVRETKEELGIDLKDEQIKFIGGTISENIKGDIINRQFNEFYVVNKDIRLDDVILQKEEVQDIKWFSKEKFIEMVNNNYENSTDKKACWDYLIRYLEMIEK